MRHASRFLSLTFALVLVPAATALAHCDRVDGPVVADGRAALEAGSLDPAAKWVSAAYEPELRQAFDLALSVRTRGDEARRLADRFFFETLVRLHRATEGEPYSGLKEAVEPLPHAVEAADLALEAGELGALPKHLGAALEREMRSRFARALEAKGHAGENVDAGRHFTAAYADFVTWVAGVEEALQGATHAHE